jgi:hypothetical protein
MNSVVCTELAPPSYWPAPKRAMPMGAVSVSAQHARWSPSSAKIGPLVIGHPPKLAISIKWPPTTTSLYISTTTYIACHLNMKSYILAFANSSTVLLASFSGSLALIYAFLFIALSIAFLIAFIFANLVFRSATIRLRFFGPRSSLIYDSKLYILL